MKQTTLQFRWWLVLIVAGVFIIHSCKKDKDESPTPTPTPTVDLETAAAEDNSSAESTYDEMNSMADEAVDGNITSYKNGGISSSCVDEFRFDKNSQDPDTVLLDFNANKSCTDRICQSKDGKYRTGRIVIIYTNRKPVMGRKLIIRSIDYCVNGNSVTGERTVLSKGFNFSTWSITDSIHEQGTIILANGGGTITWLSNRTRTLELNDTATREDDQLKINGSSSGTSAKGVTFAANITRTLVKRFCDNTTNIFKHIEIVDGEIKLYKDNSLKRIIDFGTGDCDGKATVKDANGTVIKEIIIK